MMQSQKRSAGGVSLLLGASAVWVLSLLALVIGFTDWIGGSCKVVLTKWGLEWSQEWSERSPINLAVLVVASGLVIIALREVSCWSRRTLFLIGALVVLFCAVPVFALWGVFWNPGLIFCGILGAWGLISLWVRPASES